MRLDKYISNNTSLSRKEVKDLIKKGRVEIDSIIIIDESTKVQNEQIVTLKGKRVIDQSNIVIFIDKPKGYITSMSDKEGKSVMELIPKEYEHLNLKPIGRLDKDTTGILLFTNDDSLIHKMTSKNNNIKKTYKVTLADSIKEQYSVLEEGILLKDGYKTKPAKLEILDDYNCLLTITDGKYHQVKRMFGALGNKVIELRRISFGEYKL